MDPFDKDDDQVQNPNVDSSHWIFDPFYDKQNNAPAPQDVHQAAKKQAFKSIINSFNSRLPFGQGK